MSLIKLLKGLGYYFQAIIILLRQKIYLKNYFLSDLVFPSSLEKEYYFKSTHYNRTKQYLLANRFFGELLCVLRGQKMSSSEMKSFTNLSACAPIFDDFFDNGETDLHKINELLNNPKKEVPESDMQKLAVHFLQNILSNLSDHEEFLKTANLLFEAQKAAGARQHEEENIRNLWKYSEQKGGHSGLLYALLLTHPLTDMEKEIAFDLGAFGQFMDDVFDIYDDKKNGVFTFPNTSETVKEIEAFMNNTISIIFEKIDNHNCSHNAKRDFKNILQILASAIRVALAQYKRIEKEHRVAPISCLKLDRKKWIVDMENPSNLFKMFQISLSRIN